LVNKKPKVVAKAKNAGKTNKTKESLVKCEVKFNMGEWVRPESCQTFYIDEDAKFPDIVFEIKTEEPGPYHWEWTISWMPEACPQAEGKKRFKAKHSTAYTKKSSFDSDEKKWQSNLGAVIGGDLIVKVKVGSTTFVRKVSVLGKNPTKEKILAELDAGKTKEDNELVKKIFTQESRYRQFYSDNQPLTSFDNGYGLGQLTNPVPNYEQVWNWKEHVNEILNKQMPWHRKRARKYLDEYKNYTQDMLDLETLASYNGWSHEQHYWNWNSSTKKWEVNSDVVCDPDQSNKGWQKTSESKDKSLEDFKKDSKTKPIYTGRCYAEHIKNTQR
jgi:hypothetical protein